MRHLGDLRYRIDRTQRIGGISYRHQARFALDGCLHFVHVQCAIFQVKVHQNDVAAPILGRHHPWSNVGIVVQAGDDDRIAWVESAHQRPAEVEGQAGHVGSEHNLMRVRRVQEVGRRHAGFLHQRIRLAAGGECAFVVGIVLHQIILHPVKHRARHLRAGWVIQVNGLASEGRELRAYGGQVERHSGSPDI